MNRAELLFDRPVELQAAAPPEARGLQRDQVRLLVSTPEGHLHTKFRELARYLRPGDLLVVNASATIPASLPADSAAGSHLFNLSTRFGAGVWLVEPRWSPAAPGPVGLRAGDGVRLPGMKARMIAPFPGGERLWFAHLEGDPDTALASSGAPIQYGHLDQRYPLEQFQTIFARWPGSAEMPSAGRPFTSSMVRQLKAAGIRFASIVLHAGVSSVEIEASQIENHRVLPEPYWVPEETAQAVNRARERGRRVIAVGTTVVRALETAWEGGSIRPQGGFTRVYIHPGRGVHAVDGLLTGLHDAASSHLALLFALSGRDQIRSAYDEAVRHGYLWHEFGDSHLILTGGAMQ